MKPCLKQRTRCVIVRDDGRRYEATNACDVNGHTVCPRVSAGCPTGTGYELCGSTHAEANAAALAAESADVPGEAYLDGHTWLCGHMLVRHNSSRSGPGGEMCTPATEPARTITTAGHQSIVGWPRERPDIDDCTFRMLEPREIQAAMAFRRDYTVLGNRREQVRQLGNAVTPPAAEFLIRAVVDSLEGVA